MTWVWPLDTTLIWCKYAVGSASTSGIPNWAKKGRSLDAGTLMQPGTLSDVLALRMGRSVAGTVRSFVPDARVAQMVDHFTQYVGSAPDASPAVLCGIAHMQTSEGIWCLRGGTGAIPRALTSLATELGVEMRTNSPVKRIAPRQTIV